MSTRREASDASEKRRRLAESGQDGQTPGKTRVLTDTRTAENGRHGQTPGHDRMLLGTKTTAKVSFLNPAAVLPRAAALTKSALTCSEGTGQKTLSVGTCVRILMSPKGRNRYQYVVTP